MAGNDAFDWVCCFARQVVWNVVLIASVVAVAVAIDANNGNYMYHFDDD